MIPEEELRYLAYAEEKIAQELNKYGDDQADLKQDLYEKRKYLWQELVGAERAIQDRYVRTAQESDIAAAEKTLTEAQLQAHRLKKLRDIPYFARVDFREDGYSSESFYIGKFGLTDMENFDQVICDWRSDVAALYYNFEPGAASFDCPNGTVRGELTRKRQFQIERGEMLGCFDTERSIQDQFLQRILGAHAGEQMKTIVDSIQKSQDEIIRDTAHSVVIIEGCAGSGKTSVALHRIAYLLYHARSSLSASECMIFSPNTLFEDYIASVLPDLGEDRVWQTTFADFAAEVLGERFEVRTFLDAVSGAGEPHQTEKGTRDFALRLRAAADAFESSITFDDIVIEGETLLTAEAQRERFIQNRKTLSYRQSIGRLKTQIVNDLRQNAKAIRKRISARLIEENGLSAYLSQKDLMLNARLDAIHQEQTLLHAFDARYLPDCVTLYGAQLAGIFGDAEAEAFRARCASGHMDFSDAGPVLYLMIRLGMLTRSDRLRRRSARLFRIAIYAPAGTVPPRAIHRAGRRSAVAGRLRSLCRSAAACRRPYLRALHAGRELPQLAGNRRLHQSTGRKNALPRRRALRRPCADPYAAGIGITGRCRRIFGRGRRNRAGGHRVCRCGGLRVDFPRAAPGRYLPPPA